MTKIKVLHITSGDNSTSILKKLPIEGEIITWREVLCEGKTVTEVGSELFWKTRFDFLHKTYKIAKHKFVEATLKEYRKLCTQKTKDEIILWFNPNLFSQINMMAVLSWLKHHKKEIQISLVYNKNEGKTGNWSNFSEQSENQFMQCYENRIHLTQDDVEYADYIWQLYCSDNPMRLETFSKFNSSQFEYLPDVIKAHILRFPTVKNGLNKIENDILFVASENKLASKENLIAHLLQAEKIYGFTDMQYDKIIENLKSLFHTFNPVKLNKTGKEVLSTLKNYYSFMKDDEVYLGGSKKYSFLYHENSGKLLKL